MDFIVGLPKSKDLVTKTKYNVILNVNYRLTKVVEFILQKDIYLVVDLENIIIDRIIRYYRILKTIISDRDKLFTLNYQKTIIVRLEIERKLLTAYYPKIDG